MRYLIPRQAAFERANPAAYCENCNTYWELSEVLDMGSYPVRIDGTEPIGECPCCGGIAVRKEKPRSLLA